MTVEELIEQLEDMDPDLEVRVAHQPNWPFELEIADHVIETDEAVYLFEAQQIGYLPGEVHEQAQASEIW